MDDCVDRLSTESEAVLSGGDKMGQVINRNSAPAAILAVITETMLNATNAGDFWRTEAEEILGSAASDAGAANLELETQQRLLDAAKSALEAEERRAELAYASVKDEAWNKLGRPGTSVDLSVVFISNGEFQGLDPGDKPDRSELAASLIEKGRIRRLVPEHNTSLAASLRASAAPLRAAYAAHDAARRARDKQQALRDGLVRGAHIELANLKRAYKGYGVTEADIHRIIPNSKRSVPEVEPASDAEPPEIPVAPLDAPSPVAKAV